VVLLSLSNTVQNAIIGNDNSLSGGLIGAFTLLAVNYLVVRFLFRHPPPGPGFWKAKPATLVENGRIIKSALAKELLEPRRVADSAPPARLLTVSMKWRGACWSPVELFSSSEKYRPTKSSATKRS